MILIKIGIHKKRHSNTIVLEWQKSEYKLQTHLPLSRVSAFCCPRRMVSYIVEKKDNKTNNGAMVIITLHYFVKYFGLEQSFLR